MVCMLAAYRIYEWVDGVQVGYSVPSPVDAATPEVPYWENNIAMKAKAWADVGIKSVMRPPRAKVQGGQGRGCDGYAVFDPYDFAEKNQQGSVGTRFAPNRITYQRGSAILRANGIDQYEDFVNHQRMGGKNGEYSYLGAHGVKGAGRFPLHKSCFAKFDPVTLEPLPGYVAQDPVMNPPDDRAYQFGDMLSVVNSLPEGYVEQGLIDQADAVNRAFDVQGGRLDDIKGQVAAVLIRWRKAKTMKNKYYVGEYSSGNRQELEWVLSQLGGTISLFDFPLYYTMREMCNSAATFDLRRLKTAGLNTSRPMNAMTFAESTDTDKNGTIWNKVMAYFYILTAEGNPCIFYKDYEDDPGCYNLKKHIDPLIWIHENIASGPTVYRWEERNCIVYERTGQHSLICGINSDMYGGWKTVTVHTNEAPGTVMHDHTGNNAQDCVVSPWKTLTFGIPPNHNGMGYVAFAKKSLSAPNKLRSFYTMQEFEAAPDLAIPPATFQWTTITSIYCDVDTSVNLHSDSANIVARLIDSDGLQIDGKITKKGMYDVQIKATVITAIESSSKLQVTYKAPKTLEAIYANAPN